MHFDYLTVDFIKYQDLWYSDDIKSYLSKDSYHIEKMIQKQMPNTQTTRAMLGAGENTKAALIVSLVIAFVMN
jgi:hypothetical protein